RQRDRHVDHAVWARVDRADHVQLDDRAVQLRVDHGLQGLEDVLARGHTQGIVTNGGSVTGFLNDSRGDGDRPASRGRRGCYYCRRDMRPTDSPDHRLWRRCPRSLQAGSGEGGVAQTRLRTRSCTRLARSLPLLATESRRCSRSETVFSISRRRWRSSRSTRTRALRTSRSSRLRAVAPRRSKRRSWAWALVEDEYLLIVSLTPETTLSRAVRATPTGISTARSAYSPNTPAVSRVAV